MNRQIFFFLVFSFSCFVQVQAQEVIADRQTPAAEAMDIRKGEVVDFQKLMRRLETAIKENDIPSANDLRSDVVSAMKKRIQILEADLSGDQKQTADLKEQKEILKATEAFEFSSKAEDKDATMAMLKQFHQFERLMEQNFERQ